MTGPTDRASGTPALTYEVLEARRLATEDRLPDDLGLRLRRSLSWLDRAEKETTAGDHDAAFIFYWIAFNAAYQKQHSPVGSPESPEREHFTEYFRRLISLDSESAVYDAVWQRFSESIRVLLENRYVFQPFWNHLNGVPGYENWESRFAGSHRTIGNALARQNTEMVLSILFDRLYVLRNQLVHGGATWNGSVNRAPSRGRRQDHGLPRPAVRQSDAGQPRRTVGGPALSPVRRLISDWDAGATGSGRTPVPPGLP